MSKKILVTAGCSFSDIGPISEKLTIIPPNYVSDNINQQSLWPIQLQNHLNIPLISLGRSAEGNGMISRRLLYKLTQLLNEYKPEGIYVGIMWSGMDRGTLYVDQQIIPSTKTIHGFRNPTKFVDEATEKKWVIANACWTDISLIRRYFQLFSSDVFDQLQTLEHILRIQDFCKLRNINYFCTTYSVDVLVPEYYNHPECKYLYDLIDFSNWLPVENMHNWCEYYSGLPFPRPDDDHPSEAQHKKFTEEVIAPFVDKLGWSE